MHFLQFVWLIGVFVGALLIVAVILHLIAAIGGELAEAMCRAPCLDVVIGYFTVGPLIAGPIIAGWGGLLAGIVGQVVAMNLWVAAQELIHRRQTRGPRIVKVINRLVGRWRNHAAIWVTALAVPGFILVRLLEVTVYPMLTLLVGLPWPKQRDWVNVSRHKFRDLVGHDLIWCLYCDWMTGIVSLAVEMLRNVESFWCPIRFASDKKCDNCCVDFPDINQGWVAAGGSMEDVTRKLEEMYGGGERAWFNSPVRLTVGGKEA